MNAVLRKKLTNRVTYHGDTRPHRKQLRHSPIEKWDVGTSGLPPIRLLSREDIARTH